MTRCPPRIRCRGVVPALSHIMLHSDQLANEFNDILNGVEIFAPFQPLDPAVTFYAPLRTSVRDLRLNQDNFQRASDAWYKDGSGIYRNVGINRPRFEQSRLLMEPAITNKCENYNANPDAALTGLTLTSGPGELSRQYEAASLAVVGLQDICPSGYVIQLEDFPGGATTNCLVDGVTGNTDFHTFSAWIRRVNDIGSVTFGDNSAISVPVTSPVGVWERVVISDTPDAGTRLMRLSCFDGAIAQMILNQLEQSPVVGSPIVTEGTAGQRAVDRLHWSAPNAFNAPQGMCIFQWVPRWSGSDYPFGLRRDTTIVTFRDTSPGLNGLCRLAHFTNNAIDLETNDGVATVGLRINQPDLIANQRYTIAVRWNDSPSQKQVGMRLASGWDWSQALSYSGSYLDDDIIRVSDPPLYGQEISNLELWNEDRGTAWIEANYP